MTFVLIYGAPGTGKYTIGKELAKATGYVLVHNHIILNALSEIFGFDNPSRKKLEKEFRLRIIEEAVKADINIIVTGVIMRDNEQFYKQMIQSVKDGHGKCVLIRLTASQKVLENRISNKSRKKMNKINTIERLREWTEQYPESFESINFDNQINIDTSHTTPKYITEKIIRIL